MAAIKEDKTAKRKVQTSNLVAVVSISLMLFMLGFLGLIVLYAQILSVYLRENFEVMVIMKEDAKEVDILRLQKFLDAEDFARATEYVTKEKAAEIMTEEVGSDFVDFLGTNPLHASLDIRIKADYLEPDSLLKIKEQILKNDIVQEVSYQEALIKDLQKNTRRIGFVLLLICGMLSIVAIAVINNTIRLSVYSKRFLIRSMQLVGATQRFIRRPFVISGILRGIFGALVADAMLVGVVLFIRSQMPVLFDMQQLEILAVLFFFVILLGIVISWLSTAMAVRRYLRLNMEELYY